VQEKFTTAIAVAAASRLIYEYNKATNTPMTFFQLTIHSYICGFVVSKNHPAAQDAGIRGIEKTYAAVKQLAPCIFQGNVNP